MKVLQLCHKPPYPKKDGGCIAIASISEALFQRGYNLKILATSTHKHPWDKASWPKHLQGLAHHVEIDTELNPLDALKNILGSGSYNVERFYSEEFASSLSGELKKLKPDIVWLEGLFMTPYLGLIRKESTAKVILRAHNIEHVIWERMAQNSNSTIKRPYLSFLAKRLKKYELEAIKRVDGIAALTDLDLDYFRKHSDSETRLIPIGIEIPKIKPSGPNQSLTLFHLGDMNWEPNREAIEYFLDQVWPEVRRACPEAKCYLAGRNMPQSLVEQSYANLSIQGEVESADSFFNEHDVMILPLQSGGGMRVKMLEAMALGKIIITTTIGAEGVNGVDGQHYLLADSPEDFAQKINELYSGVFDLDAISKAAQDHVKQKFSNEAISADVDYFCRHLAGVEQQ
jgi:glycosyltransferase involved in cell wall biosynthesis